MRFYGSIEDANKAAQTRANAYRNAAGYINTVAQIIRQFDGKVYNCRLDKALKEATEGRVFCNRNQYLFEIYTYPESHYSFHIGLANIKAEDLTEGKRIPADKIIKTVCNGIVFQPLFHGFPLSRFSAALSCSCGSSP